MSDQSAPRAPTIRKAHDVEGRLRRYMPMVFRAARQQWELLGRRVDQAELVTAGAMALLRAAESHDDRRASFAHHVRRRLGWAMKDVARRRLGRPLDVTRGAPTCAATRFGDGNRRVAPVIEADAARVGSCLEAESEWSGRICAMDLADDLAISDDDSPEHQVIRRDLIDHLCRALHGLDDKQRRLVERHYLDGERFSVVAGELGISTFAACRLHRRALDALERALRPVWAEERALREGCG